MFKLRFTKPDFFLPKNIFRKLSFFVTFVMVSFFVSSCMQVANNEKTGTGDTLTAKNNTAWKSEDEFYMTYRLRDKTIKLTDIRPDKKDTSVFLCIPAAFTLLDNGTIDGLFMVDGKIKKKSVNHHLGGGMLITNNTVSILKTDDGKLPDSAWIKKAETEGCSFFQQIQLVRESKSLEFNKDVKLFQRRAICIYTDNSVAVVESKSPLTLQEFADDLVKMKVKDAIYTDMGSYDEGWVRENGKITTIGKNRVETAKQSNWVIFVR